MSDLMNGDGSDPDISCGACDWSGIREMFRL